MFRCLSKYNLFLQNNDDNRVLIPKNQELMHNPKYEELFAPEYGPENPFQTQQMRAHKNILSGYVENAYISEFQFENQRRTFTSYGYAVDPSTEPISDSGKGDGIVGKLNILDCTTTKYKNVLNFPLILLKQSVNGIT